MDTVLSLLFRGLFRSLARACMKSFRRGFAWLHFGMFMLGTPLGCAVALLFASQAEAQDITWNLENAVVEGSGCSKDLDTFLIASGNEVSIVFSNLGIALSGDEGLLGNKTCNVRIPATIASGLYLAELDQSYLFGVVKSPGSDGMLRNRARFFGLPVSVPELTFLRGTRVNDPQKVERRREKFSPRGPVGSRQWVAAWCKRDRPKRGAFDAQIRVQGRRDSVQESVIIFVDGLDLRYDVMGQIQPCES